jgi:hypothetical protein
MDHFRPPNNAFPGRFDPTLSPFEHNWMQSDAGRAEFYAELARLYQHPDHYFPSHYPPQGPAAASHYEHSVPPQVQVRPVNNYAEPEEVN